MRVFVTGASGWIGSAVVPELLTGGHEVTGLARSDASAEALAAAGADVVRGDLDDLDVLRTTAAASDGVIHLAFKHDSLYAGDFAGAVEADARAIAAFGEALAGTDRPFVIASGLAGHAAGSLATEDDAPDPSGPAGHRMENERVTLGFATSGVRSASVRLAPTVHGEGDHGFIAAYVGIARETGVAGYIGDGSNTWPAVHRSDAARLFRLALESAPAGTVLHAAAEEGVALREIAETVGSLLGVPAEPREPEHFGWLGTFLGIDVRASSTKTRALLGWEPTGPTLVEDLPHYTAAVTA